GEVIVGPLLHGQDGGLDAAMRSQEQRLQLGLLLLEPGEYFNAVHPGQVQIEQGHVEALVSGCGQGFLAAGGSGDRHALALEATNQGAATLLVVIHDEEAQGGGVSGRHGTSRDGAAGPRAGGRPGTVNQKRLPRPGSLSTQTWPPPCSTM